ncbi:MAG TPA: PH domain-containing protein [Candidatus Saccharimonadales bacterium]|nr:PH domain-containing protein [Candidatus Saccharimonadales bacterium]
MPQKYFADQFDHEEVLFIFRKHPIVMRRGLIIAGLGVLVGPLYTLALTFLRPNDSPSMTFFGVSFLVSLVIATILFLPAWIGWHFSVFIVTDQRLIQITQKGLFHRSVVDMGLAQIQMVNYQVAGLAQTLFGFGTIMMQTFVGDLVIHDVHHPATIQKKLLEILRDEGIAAQNPYTQTKDTAVEDEA